MHVPSPLSTAAEFEGLVEYSYKLFATRKEKIQLATDGEGPLVSLSVHQLLVPFSPYRWRGSVLNVATRR